MATQATIPAPELSRVEYRNRVRNEFRRRLERALIRGQVVQAELARRSGLERDRITKFVKGQQLPGRAQLDRLIAGLNQYGLNLSPEDLIVDLSVVRGALSAEVEEAMAEAASSREHDMPVATRTFEFVGKEVKVRINETLPLKVAMAIIHLLEEVDAAAAGSAPRQDDDPA